MTQIEQWSKCRTTFGALFSRLLGLLPLLKAGRGGDDYLKLADAADEIARRDAVLRPLSLALPELRILLHPDESGKTKRGAPCNGWWHARCGYDWTDPVFF